MSTKIGHPRNYLTTLLLSFFFGAFGIHRFYTGYVGIGIAQFFTCGGCGLWALIDFILICFNNYKDAEDRPLVDYNKIAGITFFIVKISMIVIGFVSVMLAIVETVK